MPNELVAAFQWIEEMRKLVCADDPAKISRLEALLGCTQEEAVDHFVEVSCWGYDLPGFRGSRGTPQERRAAVRAAWRAEHVPEPADD